MLFLETAASTARGFGSYSSILMLVLIFVVFWLFLIRPENKKKKKLEQMRSALSVGDEIVTIGGITGKVVQATEDTVTFETGEDRVRIQVKKWAISTNVREEAAEEAARTKKKLGGTDSTKEDK